MVTIKQRGFTLIELLLAAALMAMLMLTATMAYSFMQKNWQRQQTTAIAVWSSYQHWQLLHKVLNNTTPKMLYRTKPSRSDTSQNNTMGFYFLGRNDGFTAMTNQSMQRPDTAAVYRLFKEPDPEAPDLWQLVYEEALLNDQLLVSADQVLPFDFRRVLANNLNMVQFSYKGWQSVRQRISSQGDDTLVWQSSYDGMQTQHQPISIKVTFDTYTFQQNFADDSARFYSQIDTDN